MAEATRTDLRVDLLGPLRCAVDHEPVEVPRAQVRKLLAVLVANRQASLSTDELIEQLWPEDQPVDPRAAIRVVLSRLRATLGAAAGCLESGPKGHRLNGVGSDLVDFARLVDEARSVDDPSTEVALLEEALALWRGTPFVDVAGPALLDETARALDEARWFARSRLVEALQEVGDHDAVTRQAAGWAAERPHHERLAANLATSLAQVGRKGDALHVIETTRRVLRDEFGVDPSTRLLDTEHAILTGAVELGDRRPTTRTGDELVGRAKELASLATGTGTTVVVGEPGVGKSTLLEAFAERLAADGHPVARAAASESPRRPLEPIATLVTALVGPAGPRPSAPDSVLRRLYPDEASTGRADQGVITRESLVRACAILLIDLAESSSATLLVDDGHWLDDLSAAVLTEVHEAARCTLVVGARPTEQLDGLLPGAVTMPLAGLSNADALTLLGRRLPSRASTGLADDLHDRSGGNPLFLRLLIDELAEGAQPAGGLPTSLLVTVQRRLDELRRRSVRALEVAALLGPTFSLKDYARLRPQDAEALEEAVEALLLTVDEGTGTGRFVHTLVAEGIVDLIAPARQIDLHHEIALSLEDSGSDATAYARHYEASAMVDPTRAVRALLDAGSRFTEALAWVDGRDYLERALAVHERERRSDDLIAAEALVMLGAVLQVMADPSSDQVLVDAAALARRLGDDVLFARAVVELCGHGRTLAAGTVDPRAAELLDTALQLDLPAPLRSELCAGAATLLSTSDRHEPARLLYREAYDTATRSGSSTLEVDVLMRAHLGLAHPDDFELRLVAADRLGVLGVDDVEISWEAAFLHAGNAMVQADRALLDECMAALRALTPLIRARPRRFGLAFTEAAAALIIGDLDAAEAHLDATLTEGLARYPESWVMSVYSSVLLGIRHAQGRVGELAPVVASLLEESPHFPTWLVVATVAALDNGDTRTARRHWDTLREDQLASLIPDHTWTAGMGFAGRIAVALGDEPTARIVYERLGPHAEHMLWAGTCTYGPAAEVLALLAAEAGDHQAAAAHAAVAEDLVQRLRAPAR
ncbi:MAG: AAA family ATPase [Acidimicrobiales bacterium]|nr:AAA family ATPase [Acidimicrobiales bacterium]